MQSNEEKLAVIQNYPWPERLAETTRNAGLIGDTIVLRFKNVHSNQTIDDTLKLLWDELDWLAVPAPATVRQPKKSLQQKLYEAGVEPSRQMSHREKAEARDDKNNQWDDLRQQAAVRQEKEALRRKIHEAKTITLGTHAKSYSAREAAVAQLRPVVAEFNKKHPDMQITDLV